LLILEPVACKYFDILTSQNEWIAENYDRLNMKYIVHTGDFVDLPHNRDQWDFVTKEYEKWDKAGLAYGVLAGNHDVDKDDHTEFSEYFGEDRYNKNPWYGEGYDGNFGHYDLVTIGGVEFMFAYLGYGDHTEEDIAWLNSALDKHSDRIAVLAFHDYLTISGVRSDAGEKLFNEVVLTHPNVRMVLCGHNYLATRRIDEIDDNGDGKADRTVYQMMANYQNLENGGNGFFRLMTFDVKAGTIDSKTYSPYLDKYNAFENSDAERDEYGYQDEFIIPFDFSAPTPKTDGDPQSGEVVFNSRIAFAATDSTDAFVVPLSYVNAVSEDGTFNAGAYDRTFSLSATDAVADAKSVNYVVVRYKSKEGYRVDSVIKGDSLADDAVVSIPYDGLVVALSADAVDQKGNAVDVDAIEVGQVVTLNQMNGFSKPLMRKFTINLTCPWGADYGINDTNRMIGNDQWIILDSEAGDSAADTGDTHQWSMLFAFAPTGNEKEYKITEIAVDSGEAKDLAIPENGFVLAMNCYSGKHSLGESIRERFVVGMTATLDGYEVK